MAEQLRQAAPLPIDSPGNYKPISGVAIAAMVVAGLSGLLMLVIGLFVVFARKPFLVPLLLLLPLAGVGLAVAARWHIENSEGTRTGERLTGLAWWVSVLSAAGYAAYLGANELAVRQQSTTFARNFFNELKQGQYDKAFLMTIGPAQRQGIDPVKNPTGLEVRFGGPEGPLTNFRYSELIRLFKRAGDRVSVADTGVRSPSYEGGGYRMIINFELKTPEGIFDIPLVLIGSEGKEFVGRQWSVLPESVMNIANRKFTRAGRLAVDVANDARTAINDWLKLHAERKFTELYAMTLPAGQRPKPGADIAGSQMDEFLEGRTLIRLPDGTYPASKSFELRSIIKNGTIRFPMSLLKPGLAGLPDLVISNDSIIASLPVELAPPLGFTFLGRMYLRLGNPEAEKIIREEYAKNWPNPIISTDLQQSLLGELPPRDWQVLYIETTLQPPPPPPTVSK
jgi:hypothetical protein